MKRLYAILTSVVFATVLHGAAQEKFTLAQPVFVDVGATEFRLSQLTLNRRASQLSALFSEVVPGTTTFIDGGRTLTCTYNGTTADALLASLNKMNFTNTSLEKRVIQQCMTDSKLGVGVISGVPQ